MSLTLAYIQCSGGDFFHGECCPSDGHGSVVSKQLDQICAGLRASGREITFSALAEAGMDAAHLSRVVILQFPSESVAWPHFRPVTFLRCPKCQYFLPPPLNLSNHP